MKRTATLISESQAVPTAPPHPSPPKADDSSEGRRVNRKGNRRGMHPNSLAAASRNRAEPYPKGVSGNPSGLPGYDVAAKIYREAFTENEHKIKAGVANQLIKGEPYAHLVYGDRAYGKVADKQQIELQGKMTLEMVLEARKRAELAPTT